MSEPTPSEQADFEEPRSLVRSARALLVDPAHAAELGFKVPDDAVTLLDACLVRLAERQYAKNEDIVTSL